MHQCSRITRVSGYPMSHVSHPAVRATAKPCPGLWTRRGYATYLMCLCNWYHPPSLLEAASIPMAWVLTPLGVRGVTMHAENVSSTVYDCAIYNQTQAG